MLSRIYQRKETNLERKIKIIALGKNKNHCPGGDMVGGSERRGTKVHVLEEQEIILV